MQNDRGFLKSKPARLLTLALLVQAGIFYGLSRGETSAPHLPLAGVPAQIGSWRLVEEGVVEKEVAEVLKADELLNRSYGSPAFNVPAHLFVAYFNSQRTGQAPHSPKNCLPGSGWTWTVSDRVSIDISGRGAVQVNRYVIQKGEYKSVVLYWYQSRDRVVASEYAAKLYTVADSIRHNRTDTALVRVVVPVVANDDAQANRIAVKFVQDVFNPLRRHFPA